MNRDENFVIQNPYARRKRKRPTQENNNPLHSSSSRPSVPSSGRNDIDNERNSNKDVVSAAAAQQQRSIGVSARASALVVSASDKAGMEGIDRSRIDAIILRESGDSKYIQQQRRRDEKVNEKVRQLKQRLLEASPRDYRPTEELDEMLRSFQKQQATRATCVVVDMDMFYMACELLTRPDLDSKPACVGRGMILTSNYVARRYGVRSAMAGFIGDKLVEELSKGKERLIHVRSNFDLYKEKSKIVKEVIGEYDPHNMKSYSLDEVYLDIGPYLALFIRHRDYTHEQIRDLLLSDGETDENGNKTTQQHASATEDATRFLQSQSPLVCLTAVDRVVSRLRRHVRKATGGLTCSAGVARSHTIAKIASDKNKPNGQLVVDPANTLAFVRDLPVRKIPGVGRVTEKLLQNVCKIDTVMDLYQKRGLVRLLFQPATANFLLKASVGCSGEGGTSTFGMVDADEEQASSSDCCQKGISKERTFQSESDWAQLNIRLEGIARSLAKDMIRKSVMGHTITVKVKLETFDVLSKAKSQKRGVYIQNPEELATIASGLFAEIRAAHQRKNRKKRFSVRLLGIRCSNLIEDSSVDGKPQEGAIDKFLTSATGVSPHTNVASSSSTEARRGGSSKKPPIANHYYATRKTVDVSPNTKHNRYKQAGGTGVTDAIHSNSENTRRDPTTDCRGVISDTKTSSARMVTPPSSQPPAPATKEQNHAALDTKMEGTNDDHDKNKTADNRLFVVHCPLCRRSFLASDNDLLNAHIDTCLNGIYGNSTVRKIVREEESRLQQQNPNPNSVPDERSSQGASRGKRKLLTDFWN